MHQNESSLIYTQVIFDILFQLFDMQYLFLQREMLLRAICQTNVMHVLLYKSSSVNIHILNDAWNA